MESRPSQDQVIEAFVVHLAALCHPGLQIIDWPDKKPGASREIDALAESPDVRVAIEHTSVDSFDDQRADSARFMEVIGKLESELRGQIPSSLHLIVDCGAVPTKTSWKKIHDILRSWIENAVHALPEGKSEHNIPGVPFPVYIRKDSSGKPGLSVARYAPDDHTLPDRLRSQIKDKAAKLNKYKEAGCFTILLLESSDIALMSPSILRSAVKTACSPDLPAGVDSIWYADTAVPETVEFWDITPV